VWSARRLIRSARRNNCYTRTVRKLRCNKTDAGMLLWSRLSNGCFAGTNFRDEILGQGYVVDFCNEKNHLIIHMDGSQHMPPLPLGEEVMHVLAHIIRFRR